MNYSQLTKAQLVQYAQDLEEQLDEAVKIIETQSLGAKFEIFKREASLLGQDVVKLVRFAYESGVAVRRQIDQVLKAQGSTAL